jgi:hypothetical protein
MIAATLLAFASVPALPVADTAAYARDAIAHLKGHPVAPARSEERKTRASEFGCHPDIHKGRSCRLRVAKIEQRESEALARSGHEETRRREVAP